MCSAQSRVVAATKRPHRRPETARNALQTTVPVAPANANSVSHSREAHPTRLKRLLMSLLEVVGSHRSGTDK